LRLEPIDPPPSREDTCLERQPDEGVDEALDAVDLVSDSGLDGAVVRLLRVVETVVILPRLGLQPFSDARLLVLLVIVAVGLVAVHGIPLAIGGAGAVYSCPPSVSPDTGSSPTAAVDTVFDPDGSPVVVTVRSRFGYGMSIPRSVSVL
jgi:hypothetical protein